MRRRPTPARAGTPPAVRHALAEVLEVSDRTVDRRRCGTMPLDADLLMDLALVFECAYRIRFTESELTRFTCLRDIARCVRQRLHRRAATRANPSSRGPAFDGFDGRGARVRIQPCAVSPR